MYEVTVEPTGEVISIKEGQTILDSLLRAGLSIPYQCGHGLCSTCKVNILEGDVDHGEASPFALMDFERDEGVTLACSALALSDLVIEADIDVDPDTRVIPVDDFEGTVEELKMLTSDIMGVWLRLSKPLDFHAGQYVNLHIPGVGAPRAFSIASTPEHGDLIELHVRMVPDGKATGYIHEQLKVGDSLKLAGPLGRFYVRKSRQSPMIFVAGGSGLSSPKSMVLDLLDAGCATPIHLMHGTRTPEDVYYQDVFEALQERHENFTYTPVPFSVSPDGRNWSGRSGAVPDAMTELYPDGYKGMTAYLCGPPGMIEDCVRALMKGRLFEKDIFTEGFLTMAEAETAPKSKVFSKF